MAVCDSPAFRVVLGAQSEVLDVGRLTHARPAGIRRAITLRDGGCVFPGCDRPPSWCDIHHCQPWEHGGPTNVDNGTLPCRKDDTLIHQHQWFVTFEDGNRYYENPTASSRHQPLASRRVIKAAGSRPAGAARVGQNAGMAEWIYFIHAPRENFAETMTDEEQAVWGTHFERLQRLLAEGVLILAGPTLGPVNTGIAVIEAPDEAEARRLMEEDPAIRSGIARGELRPFLVSLLRGRD
jgi:uncharacterized protein YciI